MAFSGVRRGSAEILEEQDGDRTICAHKSPSRFFISFNMNLAGCLVRNVRGVENNEILSRERRYVCWNSAHVHIYPFCEMSDNSTKSNYRGSTA
uniref:Uncharacterized protein n=1 Tax=Vespula pensylvanica TaxID=30213 RepID=A0A834UCB8_VESPE|nr:hypothetical protein H0235_004239 [Vespula pensylvanica]